MNDSNWFSSFFDSILVDAGAWDVDGKAEAVQEAAAEAMLAERERFLNSITATGPNDPRHGLDEDEFNDAIDRAAPYPADPYSMDIINEIPSHFLWLSPRDPSELPGKQETADGVAEDLALTLPDGIGNLQSLLVDNRAFQGRVADRFATFLDNMVDVAENQGSLAKELSKAVATMDKLLRTAKKDVDSVADETIKALNGIRDGGSGSGSTVFFLLAGISIGIASAATGGTAAIAWALLAGTVTFAEAASEEQVAGEQVEDVLNQMFRELKRRQETFSDREDDLVAALNQDIGTADSHRYQLCPDTDGDNLYDGRGDLSPAGSVLAVDLADTHRYATTAVPKLAGTFGSASTALSGASGTATVAMGPASLPWEKLCTKLQRYSALTSNRLYDGGDILAKATVAFAKQDGINAKWVTEPLKDHVGPDVPEAYTPPDPNLPPWMR